MATISQIQITIVVPMQITGSLGTKRYFLPSEQYVTTETSMMVFNIIDVSDEFYGQKMIHYKVLINDGTGDEDFYIPKVYAPRYEKTIPEEYINKYRHEWDYRHPDEIKDFRRAWKEYLGLNNVNLDQEEIDWNMFEAALGLPIHPSDKLRKSNLNGIPSQNIREEEN